MSRELAATVCSVLPIVALGVASAVCFVRTRRAVMGMAHMLRPWR